MRQLFLKSALAFSLGALTSPMAFAAEMAEVYKSPTCGCCSLWVEHLRQNGFEVVTRDVHDVGAYKSRYGVPRNLSSCHTARVGGYIVEGHVPARELKRLLAERPKAVGLAVPAMPMGSPGMEGPRKDSYRVLLFDSQGRYRTYARYD